MEFQDAECPNCGGSLQLPDSLKTAKCIYCGSDITVRDAINAAGVSPENLLKRAAFAAEAGNYQEAYDYFTRVLEYEPRNHVALLGKAEAAARLSPPSRFRAEELIRGVAEAVASAPAGSKGNVERRAAEMICSVCSAYAESLAPVAEPGDTIQRVAPVLDCLEAARNYVPYHPQVLESLVAGYRTLRWAAEANKATNERLAIVRHVRTAPSVTASLNNLIAQCHRKRDEHLSTLNRVAPERAALQMEGERKVEEQIRKNRVGGCAKAWGCWITIGLTLLLALAALFSVPA
ncbi:MAG: hypothetical protein M3348_16990 [Acidobacteriota bacterium]|nr:hypothetical protein [Acidobacteriota bacterium]